MEHPKHGTCEDPALLVPHPFEMNSMEAALFGNLLSYTAAILAGNDEVVEECAGEIAHILSHLNAPVVNAIQHRLVDFTKQYAPGAVMEVRHALVAMAPAGRLAS